MEEIFPVPYDELPEVIVTAYSPAAGEEGIHFNDYMLLQSMFSGGGGDGGGGSSKGGGGGYSGGYGGGSSAGDYGYSPIGGGNGSIPNDPNNTDGQDITVHFDESAYRPGIDLNAWLNCFSQIPDVGASYTVTLYADLPIDDDPSYNVNLFTGATGHCFLELTKTNGSQSVSQVLGFTAQAPFKALFSPDQFLPSKMVDNAAHKYDASITLHVNGPAFTTMTNKMKELATLPYSITRFDCLDYDLSVINSIRPYNAIVLPANPNSTNVFDMISTGERLYNLLEQMKYSGSQESANIMIGNGAQYFAGLSHGPCN